METFKDWVIAEGWFSKQPQTRPTPFGGNVQFPKRNMGSPATIEKVKYDDFYNVYNSITNYLKSLEKYYRSIGETSNNLDRSGNPKYAKYYQEAWLSFKSAVMPYINQLKNIANQIKEKLALRQAEKLGKMECVLLDEAIRLGHNLFKDAIEAIQGIDQVIRNWLSTRTYNKQGFNYLQNLYKQDVYGYHQNMMKQVNWLNQKLNNLKQKNPQHFPGQNQGQSGLNTFNPMG